jgi:hypothetical protein
MYRHHLPQWWDVTPLRAAPLCAASTDEHLTFTPTNSATSARAYTSKEQN